MNEAMQPETSQPENLEQVVEDHLRFVYDVAVRQVRNSHLAQDVTQAVFIIFLRKQRGLPRGQVLRGWFHRTTLYAARNALRMQSRRRRHETAAAGKVEERNAPAGTASLEVDAAGSLDAALASLRDRDRTALLLRYYDGLSLAALGTVLGTTEEGARKRVTRAISRLRAYFHARGLDVTRMSTALLPAAVLPSAELKAAVLAAPGKALASGSVAGIVKGVAEMAVWAKVKFGAAVAACALLAAGAVGLLVAQLQDGEQVNSSGPATVSATAPLWTVVNNQPVLRFDVVAETEQGDLDALRRELHAAVAAAEKRVRTIRVEANHRSDRWDAIGGEWKLSGEGTVTVWREADTLRVRAEVDRELGEWTNGAAPFAESQYIHVWDGRRTSMLFTKNGVPGAPPHRGDGRVASGYRPAWNWGWEHSTYGLADATFDPEKKTRIHPPLSALLEDTVPEANRPTLRRVRLNAAPVVEVTTAVPWEETLFIDLARGASLRGVLGRGNGRLQAVTYVEQLLEAAPETFYPQTIHQQLFVFRDPAGPPEIRRTRIDVRSAQANPPDWPESLFKIDWPANVIIFDQTNNLRFRPGEEPAAE
jgi:RNA polymerase sigma factor (sigma-70 family)